MCESQAFVLLAFTLQPWPPTIPQFQLSDSFRWRFGMARCGAGLGAPLKQSNGPILQLPLVWTSITHYLDSE